MVTREQIERSINADYCRKEIRRGIKVICIALISLIIYALVGILLLQDWLFTLSMVGILGGIGLSLMLLMLFRSVRLYKNLFDDLPGYELHTAVLTRPEATPQYRGPIPYSAEFKLSDDYHVVMPADIFLRDPRQPKATDYTNKSVQIAYNPTTKQLVILGLTPEQTENA